MHSLKTWMIVTLSGLAGWEAYGAIVGLLIICGLGVPLPEDITLVTGGILSALHSVTIFGAILAGIIGVMAGDAFLYTVGRIYGRKAFKLPIIRAILTPRRIAIAERKIVRNSHFICFTARFLPGLRSPVFLMAGILRVRPLVFYGLDGLAALISVPVWVLVGHWVGENLDLAFKVIERVQISIAAIIAALIATYFIYRRWRKTRRAQRLMFYMNSSYRSLSQDPQLNPK